MRRWIFALALVVATTAPAAQQQNDPNIARPIDPGRVALPAESDTVGERKFSFIAYGDTRGQADGEALQHEHGRIVDAMIEVVKSRASESFPVRFIVQSGDGVSAGSDASQWNNSYTPLIERLIRESGVPYFLAVGNHDVTSRRIDDPQRQPGLRNVLSLMSRVYPPDGSPRRLSAYPTFGFGYGNVFVLAIDSNIAGDQRQLNWVTQQLDGLDRDRYQHVIVTFHHPIFSSGPHGGSIVETSTELLRASYVPLFRKHHVRIVIAGHDHLLDHWVERYSDGKGKHRIDHLVTGGGGAPIYVYNGEPNLVPYLTAGASVKTSVEHLARPGPTVADNPHHFVVVEVDGDRLSLEVFGTGPAPFRPYNGSARVALDDR